MDASVPHDYGDTGPRYQPCDMATYYQSVAALKCYAWEKVSCPEPWGGDWMCIAWTTQAEWEREHYTKPAPVVTDAGDADDGG